MTRRYFLDGTELTNVRVTGAVRNGEMDGFVSAFYGGEIGTSGIVIDDPTGALDFLGFRKFHVIEDACTPSSIWRGYVTARTIARGDLLEDLGTGRRWTCDLVDGNFLLGLLTLHAPEVFKRPAETNVERTAWLLTTSAMTDAGPGIFDNGFVLTSPVGPFDEADYLGQFPSEVLASVHGAFSTETTFSVYWDEAASTGEEWSLFSGPITTVLGTLDAKLSNDPADFSDPDVYQAMEGQQLLRNPEDTGDGLLFIYKGVPLYRRRVATFTDYGIHRDQIHRTDRVGKAATASTQTDRLLIANSVENDTIECDVALNANQVNFFREGWRTSAKFTHIPGYEDYVETTVIKRSVKEFSYNRYVVHLTLSNKAPAGGIGGGDPGDFPHPSPCSSTSGTIVQGDTSFTVVLGVLYANFATDPTPGNTLIYFATNRVSPPFAPDDPDWILTPPGVMSVSPYADGVAIWIRPVKSSDSTAIVISTSTPGNSIDVILELEGELTLVDSDVNTSTGAVVVGPAVTPTAGSVAAVLGFLIGTENTATGPTFTASAPWTEIIDASDTAGHPQATVVYQHVASASGSYAPTSTNSFGGPKASQSIALVCSASDNPPTPGQWIYGEVPLPAPDGAETTFTTAFPFADGSLTVYVDNLDQTAAVSSFDGATGSFTLSFAPWGTDIVTVDYQGR